MAKYYLTNKAVEDLTNIWNYTYEEWSESQADKYYEMLFEAFQDFSENPDLGKSYGDIAVGVSGFKINKHIAFYRRMNSDLIEIVRILHGRMDLKVKFWEE
jgi:toxin ParE1/3/4